VRPPTWQVVVRIVLLLGFAGWSWWRLQDLSTSAPELPGSRDYSPPAAAPPSGPIPPTVDVEALVGVLGSLEGLGQGCGLGEAAVTVTVARAGLSRVHVDGAVTDAAAACLFDGAAALPWPAAEQESQFTLTFAPAPIPAAGQ